MRKLGLTNDYLGKNGYFRFSLLVIHAMTNAEKVLWLCVYPSYPDLKYNYIIAISDNIYLHLVQSNSLVLTPVFQLIIRVSRIK